MDAVFTTPPPLLLVLLLLVSEWGVEQPATWAGTFGNAWRTTGDIHATWDDFLTNLDLNALWAAYAGPGGFNDPDSLEVGNGVFSKGNSMARSHFALWAIRCVFVGEGWGGVGVFLSHPHPYPSHTHPITLPLPSPPLLSPRIVLQQEACTDRSLTPAATISYTLSPFARPTSAKRL